MTQRNNLLTRIFQGVAVLAIAALFVGLGFWQLQRAADLKESLKVARTIDTKVVTLQSVAQPRQALGEQAFNRTVSLTGKYIANFRAPNQEDGNGVVADWEVALAQVDPLSELDSHVERALQFPDCAERYIAGLGTTSPVLNIVASPNPVKVICES